MKIIRHCEQSEAIQCKDINNSFHLCIRLPRHSLSLFLAMTEIEELLS